MTTAKRRPTTGAKKKPPAHAAERIIELAWDGFSHKGIARKLGVSHNLFNMWLEQYPELREALDAGRENERQALHNKLYRLAMEKDDKVSAMFLLKARHGYREGDQSEMANKVSVTFNLPASLSLDQFQKVIDHE